MVFLVAGAVGLWFFLTQTAATEIWSLLVTLLGLVFGSTLLGVSLVTPRIPSFLTLDDGAVSVGVPQSWTKSWVWSAPRFRVEIRDCRADRLRPSDFILSVGRYVGPVTREVVDAIVAKAKSRGISVTGWSDAPPEGGRRPLIVVEK